VTGLSLLGMILLSMAWLFFIGGAVLNFQVWRAARRARPGGRASSGMPFLPGIVGSLAAFFTAGWALQRGYPLPWPWLWILLPLLLDVYCAGGLLLALFGLARRVSRRGPGA